MDAAIQAKAIVEGCLLRFRAHDESGRVFNRDFWANVFFQLDFSPLANIDGSHKSVWSNRSEAGAPLICKRTHGAL